MYRIDQGHLKVFCIFFGLLVKLSSFSFWIFFFHSVHWEKNGFTINLGQNQLPCQLRPLNNVYATPLPRRWCSAQHSILLYTTMQCTASDCSLSLLTSFDALEIDSDETNRKASPTFLKLGNSREWYLTVFFQINRVWAENDQIFVTLLYIIT